MARMRDRTGGQNRQVSSRAVPAAALRPPLCAFQVRGVRGSGHGDGRAQPDHPDPAVPQRLVLPLDRLLLCDGEHFGERPAPLRSLPLTPPPPALSRPQLAGSCCGGRLLPGWAARSKVSQGPGPLPCRQQLLPHLAGAHLLPPQRRLWDQEAGPPGEGFWGSVHLPRRGDRCPFEAAVCVRQRQQVAGQGPGT